MGVTILQKGAILSDTYVFELYSCDYSCDFDPKVRFARIDEGHVEINHVGQKTRERKREKERERVTFNVR